MYRNLLKYIYFIYFLIRLMFSHPEIIWNEKKNIKIFNSYFPIFSLQ